MLQNLDIKKKVQDDKYLFNMYVSTKTSYTWNKYDKKRTLRHHEILSNAYYMQQVL
jgi:hypothetical protein